MNIQKMKRGVLLGMLAGIIDVIPMIMQQLPWYTNASAFTHWIVVGFIISITHLPMQGFVKGLVLSYVLILPIILVVAGQEPFSIIPILIMTTLLGGLLGWLIEKA